MTCPGVILVPICSVLFILFEVFVHIFDHVLFCEELCISCYTCGCLNICTLKKNQKKRYNWYDCDQVGSYCIRIMDHFYPCFLHAFSADIGVFEGHFPLYVALWKVNII